MPDGCLEVVLHSNQALEHKHKLLRAKTACVAIEWQCAGVALDVLYAIHQLTITFVTYILKITSLTFLFFWRARKISFFCKIK